jgi:MYXO-CTERM domain-containing protein
MGDGRRKETDVARLVLGAAWVVVFASAPSVAVAMHEVDHRFTVEGHVCKADGTPAAEAQVVVKDTRVSVGTTVFADAGGHYKATLHLHNDNRGDPILVTALEQEKKVTALFDVKDVKTERQVTVNIGSGCEASAGGPPPWVYYGAGVGLAAVAVVAGARLIKKRQRSQQRGKGHRK